MEKYYYGDSQPFVYTVLNNKLCLAIGIIILAHTLVYLITHLITKFHLLWFSITPVRARRHRPMLCSLKGLELPDCHLHSSFSLFPSVHLE